MTTGQRIKKRRKDIGLSAERLAECLGVSPATIYRYESGDIEKISGDRLKPIATALQTTPAYLMGWEDDDQEDSAIPLYTLKRISTAAGIDFNEFFSMLDGDLLVSLDPDGFDILASKDMLFYREYRELPEDDQESVQQMVHVMHDRRKKENPPQD